MHIIPLIKLQSFRKKKLHVAQHSMPDSIYACILPHAC